VADVVLRGHGRTPLVSKGSARKGVPVGCVAPDERARPDQTVDVDARHEGAVDEVGLTDHRIQLERSGSIIEGANVDVRPIGRDQ
ncbi:hypothetical protein, partial [Streptococcus pneumoniae]|uniref:hypothetical protein n=1 Tax=Streptococcus pneumoniae TaxID=1313 RepID=UPI0018B0A6E2